MGIQNTKKASDLDQKLSEIEERRVEDEARNSAQGAGLAYLNLQTFPIDISALTLIEETEARSAKAAVIARSGSQLTLAVVDPSFPATLSLIENLRKQGYKVTVEIVSMNSLSHAFERYRYRSKTHATDEGTVTMTRETFSGDPKDFIAGLSEKIKTLNTSQIVELFVAGALGAHASDIHFEPEEDSVRLRYRLDGMLVDIASIKRELYHELLSRIKLHAGLKLNIHGKPQDGRFTVRLSDSDIEVRVSALPGNYGENIVMRILDPSEIRKKLEDLGMRPDLLETVRELLNKTTGAILTSGPTGSGKTTTLYAFAQHLNSPDVKIITIEDPIEYHLTGITQSQVDEAAGYTFADGLRSIVRQDPDVILVGEIRDAGTADIAMQAALTGHLVLSTIHTNNAAGIIPRLLNLGVKPATIAPAVNAAMAQRLIRRLCPDCKKSKKVSDEEKEFIMKTVKGSTPIEIFTPGSCDACNHMGYRGRVGVYELMVMNTEIEKIIMGTVVTSAIEDTAAKNGMITLLQDGVQKVLDGVTSLEEVMRVIGT